LKTHHACGELEFIVQASSCSALSLVLICHRTSPSVVDVVVVQPSRQPASTHSAHSHQQSIFVIVQLLPRERTRERARGSDYCVQPLPGYKKTDRLFCQQSQSFLMDRSAVKRFNHPLQHNKSRPRARSPLFCAHNAPRETHFARRAAAATAARDLNFAAEKYTNCVAPKCSPLAARTRRNAFG